MAPEQLIPKHGGYRRLKSFQIAQLIYDLTVQFCDRYIDRFSRTHDQMVQAARSGVQNIAEGSQASGTSKKFEIKLTNVARASLEELRLDYEDYLRQRGETPWAPDHPALVRFKKRRCASLEDIRCWVMAERRRPGRHGHTDEHGHTDGHGPTRTDTDNSKTHDAPAPVRDRPCSSVSVRVPYQTPQPTIPPPTINRPAPYPVLVANAALSLINLCGHLLDRQVAAQAKDFENQGGFTERLYRVRTAQRKSRS
ncbi:MAG: four helix bundle suffix domain-containing protein [Pseudomonadota bacterium]